MAIPGGLQIQRKKETFDTEDKLSENKKKYISGYPMSYRDHLAGAPKEESRFKFMALIIIVILVLLLIIIYAITKFDMCFDPFNQICTLVTGVLDSIFEIII